MIRPISGIEAMATMERKTTLLALLLQNPGICTSIDADRVVRLKRVRFPGNRNTGAFRAVLSFIQQTPSCTPGRVLEHFMDKPEGSLFGRMMVMNTGIPEHLVLPTLIGLVQVLTDGEAA